MTRLETKVLAVYCIDPTGTNGHRYLKTLANPHIIVHLFTIGSSQTLILNCFKIWFWAGKYILCAKKARWPMKYFFNLDSAVKNQNQGTGFWFATNVSIISTMPSANLVVLGKKKKAYRVFCEGDHQQDSQRRRIIRNRFLFYATRLLLGIAKSELFSNHFFQCCTHVKMFKALF